MSRFLSRRGFLAWAAGLLGVASGCSSLGNPDGTPDTRTADPTTAGSHSPTARDTEPGTDETPSPTESASPTGTETEPSPTETTPTLNQTVYPTIQQYTSADGALNPETAIFTGDNWRDRLSLAELNEETVEFVEQTDFETDFVIGFEVWVTEVG